MVHWDIRSQSDDEQGINKLWPKDFNINWIPKHTSLGTRKKIKLGAVLGQNLGQIMSNIVKWHFLAKKHHTI